MQSHSYGITSVLSFHGIQYGKPTRGNELEELLTPITGTYTLPGPGCPTHTPPAGSDIWGEPVVLDERCNSLNVVSPVTDVSTVLPVFVWIHGGASFTGNAADNHMDTRKLAVDSKVYVIEAQYRLGLLGFMRRDRDTTKQGIPTASINDHGGKAFAAVDTQSLSVGCYGLSKECSDNGWVCHTDDLYCIFDTFSTMEHCDQVGDAGVYGERIRQTIAAFVHDHPVKYDGVALQMPTSSNMRLLTMHGSNPSEIEFYNSRVSAFKRGVEAQLGTFASRATIGREAAERCF